MQSRNLQIDTLRGIACVLLVAFHTVGYNEFQGLKIDSGFYRDINNTLLYIRMPLFTFLSGIVYSYKPFSGNTTAFIRGKSRRLLIPMLVGGTLFALTQYFTAGSNSSFNNWYLLHIIPVGHFWFIEAIFIIFMVMIPLEKYKILESKSSFIIVFIISALLFLSNIDVLYFSISGAIYLFPFFLSGVALHRFSLIHYVNNKARLIIVCGVTLTFILIYSDVINLKSERNIIQLILGIMACESLIFIEFKSSVFAQIGLFSYSIYLYHVFFTAGIRITLHKLGFFDVNVIFLLGIIFGVIGPMLIEKIFDGSNLTRRLFLGKSKTQESELWLSRFLGKKN